MADLNARKKKKIEMQSSWSNLPDDIVYLILNRLRYVDQISFRAVCKGWRKAKLHGIVKPADKLPWMMAIDSHSCYLFDPFHKQKHTIQNSITASGILFNSSVVASKHGWVLFALEEADSILSHSLLFYTPFTNEQIQVPKFHRHVHMGTFTTSPVSSDCEIFAVNESNKQIHIGMYKLGGDGRWSEFSFEIDEDYFGSYDVEYVNGVLYIIPIRRSAVHAFNVSLKERKIYPYPFHKNDAYIGSDRLLDFNGNLLIAALAYGVVNGCIVFRLEGSNSGMKWFEVENLDHHGTLFLNYHTSLFIRIPAEEISGLMGYQDLDDCCTFSKISSSNISQVYNWDVKELKKLWIQPPQLR